MLLRRGFNKSGFLSEKLIMSIGLKTSMTREKLSQYGNLTAKKYTGKLFPNLTF
jgi:hypothetical protein